MPDMDAIEPKVIVVGAGLRGRMFADVIATDETEVVGFVDPALPAGSTVEVGRSRYRVWTDIDSAFEQSAPNAAVIATPDFLHASVLEALAQKGCAVMLEKPVATTPEDTARIKKAVESNGIYCMVAFENRWNAPFVAIRAQVESGHSGSPVFQAARLSNTYFVPTKMLSWAAQSSPIWFLMPHTVDLVQWIAGADIVEVVAVGTRGILESRGIDTWDVVHVLARLADGSTASFTSAWVLPEGHPAPVDFTYEFVGENASAFTDIGRSGVQLFDTAHSTKGVLDGVFDGVNSAPPAWMARRFLSDLRLGREPETPLATGLQVNAVLFAVERSLQSNSTEVV